MRMLTYLSTPDGWARRTGSGSTVQPSYDWSDTNPPWAYTSPQDWEQRIPTGATVVDLGTTGTTFYDKLTNTVDAAGGPVVVRLPEGVHHLTSFVPRGTDVLYAFGFYHENLQGITGAGPDKTIIQLDADSMSQTQLDQIATLTPTDARSPLQMGAFRVKGTATNPLFIGGVTFRAEDQQNITSTATSNVFTPQPAPHQGLVLYHDSTGVLSHVRIQGFGRACTSVPPFEMANLTSQYGSTEYFNCELDGRLSPDLDPAQPMRCGPYLGNNETLSRFTDCWMHHANLSRYAVNDQNRDTQGLYELIRTRIDHMSSGNYDPSINNGQNLGNGQGTDGRSDVIGFESCKATIRFTDCIIEQDNSGDFRHIRLTTVGTNPRGGRLHVSGGQFRAPNMAAIDGYLTFWMPSGTYWWTDTPEVTLDIELSDGTMLQPAVFTSWPPTPAQMQGLSPDTHYLVRH